MYWDVKMYIDVKMYLDVKMFWDVLQCKNVLRCDNVSDIADIWFRLVEDLGSLIVVDQQNIYNFS